MQRTHKIVLSSLVGLTVVSGTILVNSSASATDDTIIDQVNVTVPVSCSLEATGMNSHNTTLHNNEHDSNVGTTNAKAYCNDINGFAIYAIGYTDDTDGKNVLTDSNLSNANDITTGTATSGNDSKWAMKLSTPSSPTPTYPLAIQSDTEGSFSSFHTVPNEYKLVAKRTSATDVGTGAEGSTFTTTYQIYVGPTQPAGTYQGKVKYVLVHPNYIDQETLQNAITVVFDGNGLTFPGGATTNTVKYANLCQPGGYGYIANTPYATMGTSNLNADGTQNQNSPYTDSEYILQTITIPNADKVKVVFDYGTTGDTAEAIAIEGTWDGDWGNWDEDWGGYNYSNWVYYDDNASGTATRMINGNTVTIFSDSWGTPESGYDYGFYIKVYPIYNTEQPNTTYEELPSYGCSIIPISGAYINPIGWEYTEWVDEGGGNRLNEYTLEEMISHDYDYIKGTTINLYAYNPLRIIYHPNGNNVVGAMGDQDLEYEYEYTNLYASNFSRAGYGFAGWNDQPDYSGNFYGPNQTISTPNSNLNLYAVWVPSVGSLQSDAITACNSLTQDPNDGTADLSSVVALTDERDNNTYAIAKLADGKCWMIENLRLENTAAHNTDGLLSQGYNSSFIGLADPESANFRDSTTANSLYSINSSTDATISGGYKGFRFPRYNNINISSRQSSNNYLKYNNTYSYGNYYTWAAAIADTTNYDSSNRSIETTSICPAGWRLPRGGDKSNEANNEFWSLIVTGINNGVNPANYDSSMYPDYEEAEETASVSNTLRSYPNNFLYSGYFGAYAATRSSRGSYWSSTVGSSLTSYELYLDSLTVRPGVTATEKYYGLSIRCILNN